LRLCPNRLKLDAAMNRPEPFLRIPPFPGAKVQSLARPRLGPVETYSDAEVDSLIEQVRRLRVGGRYWEPGANDHAWDTHTPSALRQHFREQLVEPFEYVDPFTGEPLSIAEAIELCGFWRQLIESNREIGSAVGFAFWKRPTVAPLLWDGGEGPRFVSRINDVDRSKAVAVWKARTPPKILAALESGGFRLIEVEDGFIRSKGLGADCVPPLSIVVDRLGPHFDPSGPSELERLLENGGFPDLLLERAARLRELIVDAGLSKYGAGAGALRIRSHGRKVILVPGQVEDDRAILCGGGDVRSNLELLRRVRAENPHAYILFKPHPDVEAGHRVGGAAAGEFLVFADEVVSGNESISGLTDSADEVHVIGSLAGFEALLRGKGVTTHGTPFYAGWGLTRDLGPVPPRRTAKRTVDELVAAVLLLYPRYIDPVSGLPCPPEVLVSRLAKGAGEQRQGMVVQLRRLQGRWKRLASAGLR
jgi:capsular polysaccharide export protein